MLQDIDQAIHNIAKRNGVSDAELIEEMQRAIDEGFGSPDPAVRAQWAATPFREKPTVWEFILYVANRAEDI